MLWLNYMFINFGKWQESKSSLYYNFFLVRNIMNGIYEMLGLLRTYLKPNNLKVSVFEGFLFQKLLQKL